MDRICGLTRNEWAAHSDEHAAKFWDAFVFGKKKELEEEISYARASLLGLGALMPPEGLINRQNSFGHTLLTWFCTEENAEMVELLLERGANPDVANRNDDLPLHLACEKGSTEIVRLLLEEGDADVHVKNPHAEAPLDIARRNEHAEIVEILEEAIRERII